MTISFNGLGNEGRLGNQMFQYAFMRGMSKKHGYDFMIPDANANRFDNYGLFECFELEGCKTGEGSYPTLECRDTSSDMKLVITSELIVTIHNCFQSFATIFSI